LDKHIFQDSTDVVCNVHNVDDGGVYAGVISERKQHSHWRTA